MHSIPLAMVVIVIAVAIYDFTNGFHDAADMVATAIASRAMRPGVAIALVSAFTFIGPLTVGLAVADTVGTFVDVSAASPVAGEAVVIAALGAAISYNIATWWLGLPSSSSNSLAGGLVGAGLYALGSSHINWGLAALQKRGRILFGIRPLLVTRLCSVCRLSPWWSWPLAAWPCRRV